MKRILLSAIALLLSVYCMAQEPLAFPFQGGGKVMTDFFKDSLVVSPGIIAKKATGMAIFKFTADEKGAITKLVIYYADDLLLTPPIIEALKKSNRKWIIPNHEKFHDFIIPFTISFDPPAPGTPGVPKAYYDFYRHRKPVLAVDQIPLNEATLLPTIVVSYPINK
jgi:hypothetical protein